MCIGTKTTSASESGRPPMRIAVVASFAPSLVNFRGPLLRSLAEQGHELHTFAPDADPKTEAQLRAWGITHHTIPLNRNGTRPQDDLRTLYALQRAFRKIQPEVVFTYTVKPVVWGTLAATLARVPRRVAMVTGLGHAFIESDQRRSYVAQVVRSLYRVALSFADCVIFHNQDDRALFEGDKLVPSDGRAVVVHGSGVDLEHFQARPLPALPLRFLLIARLLGEKGIHEYVDAARIVKARHPDVEFRLVGPPDTNPSGISEAQAQAWDAEGILRYVGAVQDVREELAGCHVYVLPSYREGLPRTNLEAMATGRPVITTDVPGCRDTVEEGVNGFLVEVRNAQSLADACLRFIEDASLLEPMRLASRAKAEASFGLEPVNRAMRAYITNQAESA